jgi:hypothetical protein
MSRKIAKTTIVLPVTFVGTVYDHNTGVYVASRKDGSITFGRFGQKGTNVAAQSQAFAVSASR